MALVKKAVREAGKVTAIIDGQFGSTGKGLIAAYLATRVDRWGMATTNASANAGHTAVMEDGSKLVTYHLPMASVVNPDIEAYLNAGAIIDPKVLLREIKELDVDKRRVKIHPRAAIITDLHRMRESEEYAQTTKTASTRKGVGQALAAKAIRDTLLARDIPDLKDMIETIDIAARLDRHASVLMEIPQGASLSINHGCDYPHCTSRDVSVAQALADAGLHPSYLGPTVMSIRTYPIRVGHIYDEAGEKIGDSGPCYPDQKELTWKELGVKPEITTVTGRERRVFSWSDKQFSDALRINRPTHLFLNFVNYFKSRYEADRMVNRIESFGVPIMWYGTGPNVDDVCSSKEEAYAKLRF